MEKFLAFLGLIGIRVILDMIYAVFVMILWDMVMPSMFGMPEITWFKAWALTLLCDILFKARYNSSRE